MVRKNVVTNFLDRIKHNHAFSLKQENCHG